MDLEERTRGPLTPRAVPEADDEVALLDLSGVIVTSNASWDRFCLENDGDLARCGPGISYLDICDAAGDPASQGVAAAIRSALAGVLSTPRRFEIPCHPPQGARFFDLMVCPRWADDGSVIGAAVVVSPHRRGPAEGWPVSRFMALVDATPDGMAVVDGLGVIVFANHALADLSGYPTAELVGMPVDALLPGRLRAAHALARERYARDPSPRAMGEGRRLWLTRRDGTSLPVDVSLAPMTVDAAVAVVASVRDVSGRAALEARQQLVTEALDAAGDAVVVLDARTRRRLYVNQAVLDRTGYTREDLEAVPIGAPTTTADTVQLEAAIDAVVHGGTHEVTLLSHVAHRDGGSTPVEMQITFRPDPSGHDGGRVILVARDITDRLAAEHRLQVSEQSFRTSFEQSPIGTVVVVLGQNGSRRIARANDAVGLLLGLPADQLVERDFAEFSYPEDEELDREAAQQMAEGALPVYSRRKRYRRADGTPVWVEFRSSVVDIPDIEGCTAVSHIVDVTAQRQAEVRRLRLASASEAVARVTTEMLSGTRGPGIHRNVTDGVARVFDGAQVSLTPDAGARVDETVARRLRSSRSGAVRMSPAPGRGGDRPRAAARFGSSRTSTDVVLVERAAGGPPFTDDELDVLGFLGRELALAVDLGQARADQERLAVLEDRQRIARDLHDTVIQDLIAIGMQLTRDARQDDAGRAQRHAELLAQLNGAVRQLRSAVMRLDPPVTGPRLSQSLAVLVAEAARAIGHSPELALQGDVDSLPPDLAHEILAVTSEALSNVARHAAAGASSVTLAAGGDGVRLVVQDDGVGLDPTAARGRGLANVALRARTLGGSARFSRRRPHGTRLTWTVPRTRLTGPPP